MMEGGEIVLHRKSNSGGLLIPSFFFFLLHDRSIDLRFQCLIVCSNYAMHCFN